MPSLIKSAENTKYRTTTGLQDYSWFTTKPEKRRGGGAALELSQGVSRAAHLRVTVRRAQTGHLFLGNLSVRLLFGLPPTPRPKMYYCSVLSTRCLGYKHRDMRRRHAISPGFSGHYRDLGISSRKRHDSACKLILSVGSEDKDRLDRHFCACLPRHAQHKVSV